MLPDCLEFEGARTTGGYGSLWWDGKVQYAHRVAWELENGPIPEGMQVLHHCDNPPCYWVPHLFLGTDLENRRDASAKGRMSWRGNAARAEQSRINGRLARYGGRPRLGETAEQARIRRILHAW